ncbi:MAG TPA: crotonase/enoyl-CoA hydratase family protein [Acidimicrobiales bacterium]|nr:crotonase/enoyl-CoA hydratase family protein [Acidimicrobiales bacterium]
MSSTLLQYGVADRVATITLDDGKVNALSPAMQTEIRDAFDRAEKDDVGAVVLAGRAGRFSGGFDLNVIRSGGTEGAAMVRGGFEISERLLSFPKPIVAACTGHAIAMGSFLLLSVDHRVGSNGDARIQANEVAIGMTLPYAALALMRYRLTPAVFDRASNTACVWSPNAAVAAGWLDEVVAPDQVVARAQEVAAGFTLLDPNAHAATKLRVREPLLDELRRRIASPTDL